MVKTKIMIVEDEIIVSLALRKIVEHFGYEVCSVVTRGKQAVESAVVEKPDLVLMDVFLKGGMNGISAAEKIHEQKQIPIIFITGNNKDDIMGKIKNIKPSICLMKPVDVHDVASAIEQIMK